MQGVILSAGSAQGLILGDDGVRYAFTPLGYQGSGAPTAGMRVDFEARGTQAVAIYPVPGSAPPPGGGIPVPRQPGFPAAAPGVSPAPSEPAPSVGGVSAPGQPSSSRRRFGAEWWHWALAGGGAAVIALLIVGGFALGLFGPSGPPVGREVARHTHEGRTYVLVEYGKELAIFQESGPPVAQPDLAGEILRSYAWRQAIEDFDIEGLTEVSQRVQRLDDSVSNARDLSNGVVSIFDRLDDLEARVPLLGSVSAMDVVRESFVGVGEAETLIRSLDSELNALGYNTATLVEASRRIRGANLSSVSGEEMEALFSETSEAARELESTAGTVSESVSQVRESVGELAAALRAGSDTPLIGDALAGFARRADRFESELSGLASLLRGVESELGALEQDLENTLESADQTRRADLKRWLAEPYDAQWPPAGPERGSTSAGPQRKTEEQRVTEPTVEGQPAGDTLQSPQFTLRWEASASTVDAGESFTLTVRMFDVGQAGEHGGISVSFPALTESGGSTGGYVSGRAAVEVIDYTSGLSSVTFHQPGPPSTTGRTTGSSPPSTCWLSRTTPRGPGPTTGRCGCASPRNGAESSRYRFGAGCAPRSTRTAPGTRLPGQ